MERNKADQIKDVVGRTLADALPESDPPGFSNFAFRDPILKMAGNLARAEQPQALPWMWMALGAAALSAIVWATIARSQR